MKLDGFYFPPEFDEWMNYWKKDSENEAEFLRNFYTYDLSDYSIGSLFRTKREISILGEDKATHGFPPKFPKKAIGKILAEFEDFENDYPELLKWYQYFIDMKFQEEITLLRSNDHYPNPIIVQIPFVFDDVEEAPYFKAIKTPENQVLPLDFDNIDKFDPPFTIGLVITDDYEYLKRQMLRRLELLSHLVREGDILRSGESGEYMYVYLKKGKLYLKSLMNTDEGLYLPFESARILRDLAVQDQFKLQEIYKNRRIEGLYKKKQGKTILYNIEAPEDSDLIRVTSCWRVYGDIKELEKE